MLDMQLRGVCSTLCTLSYMQRPRNLMWVFWVYDSIDPMTFTTTLPVLAAGINPWENNKIGDKYVKSFYNVGGVTEIMGLTCILLIHYT